MSRRVPVQQIRGSDPTLLEVQLQDLLRRPLGQLAPLNVMDLIELASTEGRPKSLDKQLQGFVERMGREVADVPAGRSFDEFLVELEELPGDRVPVRFRDILAAELERDDRDHAAARVRTLLERWSEHEPEPFPLGQTKAKVTKAAMPQPRTPTERGGSRPPSERGSARRSSSSGSRTISMPEQDVEKAEYLRDLCLERLARVPSDKGLGERVLLAGIAHHAKERYEHVSPAEITSALKDLKDAGQVRYSAGRWSVVGRW